MLPPTRVPRDESTKQRDNFPQLGTGKYEHCRHSRRRHRDGNQTHLARRNIVVRAPEDGRPCQNTPLSWCGPGRTPNLQAVRIRQRTALLLRGGLLRRRLLRRSRFLRRRLFCGRLLLVSDHGPSPFAFLTNAALLTYGPAPRQAAVRVPFGFRASKGRFRGLLARMKAIMMCAGHAPHACSAIARVRLATAGCPTRVL